MTQEQIIEKQEKIRADVKAASDKFNSKFSNIFAKSMTNDVIAGFSKSGETVKSAEAEKPAKKDKVKEPKADTTAAVDSTVAISPKATDKTTVNPATFTGSFAKSGKKIPDNKNKNFVKPMPFVFTKDNGDRDMSVGPQGQPIPKPNTTMPAPPAQTMAPIQAPQMMAPMMASPQPVPCICGCEDHSHVSPPTSNVNEKALEPVTKLVEELGMTVQFLKDPDTSLIQAIITHNGAIVAPSCFTIDLYSKVINAKAKWFPILIPNDCGFEDYPCYPLDNLDYLKSHIMGHPISNGRLVNSPDYIELNKFIDLVTFPKKAVTAEIRSTIMTRLIMAMKKGAFDPRDSNRWSFAEVKSEKDFTLTNSAPKRIGFTVVVEPKRTIHFTDSEAIFS